MFVDDEAFNHAAFAGIFGACFTDLQIDNVFNGHEAVQRLQQNALANIGESEEDECERYLCVVMDEQMPLMTGSEACRIICAKIASG